MYDTTHDARRRDSATARVWASWTKQLLHDDHHGHWAAITLNTHYRQHALYQLMAQQCWDQSRLRPWDSRHDLRAHGACFYVLPATTWAGRQHFHGLVRVPRADVEPTQWWVPVVIREHSKPLTIRVPMALKRVLYRHPWTHEYREESIFGDLHLRHVDGYVDFLGHDTATTESILNYWRKRSDGELRNFNDSEFVPNEVRMALPIRSRHTSLAPRVQPPTAA